MTADDGQPLGVTRSQPKDRSQLTPRTITVIWSVIVVAGEGAAVWAAIHRYSIALLWGALGILLMPSLFWRVRYDFQRAWLNGTVLIVKDLTGIRRCDLATTRQVKLGWYPAMRGEDPPSVLVARDAKTGVMVRFVLRGVGNSKLHPRELHLLADALEAGPRCDPGHERVTYMVRKLRQMAEYGR